MAVNPRDWPDGRMIDIPDHTASAVFSGICRALGSASGNTFMIVTKEKPFVVEMNAVTAPGPVSFKPCFTLVSGPSNSVCVILGKELMEYPEIFPWISGISVSHF